MFHRTFDAHVFGREKEEEKCDFEQKGSKRSQGVE